MSRNTFFTVIIILAFLSIGGFAGYYFYLNKKPAQNGAQTPSFREFLPFGQPGPTQGKPGGLEPVKRAENQNSKQLFKIVSLPVSGFFAQTVGSTTIVRYVERETGHISDIDMALPSIKTRVTSTTIPRIHGAIFGNDGMSVLYRYLSDNNYYIETYSANIAKATTSSENGIELKGKFLEEDIRDVSVSPSSQRIFSTTVFGGSAIGTVSDPDGSKKAQIFNSPFSEWLSSWVNDKTILLTTKPSSVVQGFAYTLDAKSGSFKKMYKGENGFTALMSPDEKKLLVSDIKGGSLSVKIYRPDTGSLVDTGLRTIADKCVWYTATTAYCAVPDALPATPGGYPDGWYQGAVSFRDSIWKIDSETLYTDQVSAVSETGGESIDAVSLSLNKLGDYLFFINKRDGALWALKLKQ